jgi:uncharacterized protein DUF1206
MRFAHWKGRMPRFANRRDAKCIPSQTASAAKPNDVPRHLAILARAGYASRGIVYVIVGALTTAAALGKTGGRTTGAKGALIELSWQPFGYALVAALALGLCSFAAWCAFQAINDPDGYGRTLKGIIIRIGVLLTGSMYLGLAGYAVSLVFTGAGGKSTSDDPAARDWTAWLMAQPFGPWLVVGIGLGFIGAGATSAYQAWRADFQAEMTMSSTMCRWAAPVCRFGLCARGFVSLVIGGYLIIAAHRYDPSQARGVVGALTALREQPYGQLVFAMVAIGLLAFGVFGLIEAGFRRLGKKHRWPSGDSGD